MCVCVCVCEIHFWGPGYLSRFSDSLRVRRFGDRIPVEGGGGRDFPHPSRPTLEPTQPPIQWVSGTFAADKAIGAWRWLPTPCGAEVKERVELPSGPSSVLEWNAPFFFSWRYNPPSGVVFYSPLAGFGLLACEVSWSHTTKRHSR